MAGHCFSATSWEETNYYFARIMASMKETGGPFSLLNSQIVLYDECHKSFGVLNMRVRNIFFEVTPARISKM